MTPEPHPWLLAPEGAFPSAARSVELAAPTLQEDLCSGEGSGEAGAAFFLCRESQHHPEMMGLCGLG